MDIYDPLSLALGVVAYAGIVLFGIRWIVLLWAAYRITPKIDYISRGAVAVATVIYFGGLLVLIFTPPDLVAPTRLILRIFGLLLMMAVGMDSIFHSLRRRDR